MESASTGSWSTQTSLQGMSIDMDALGAGLHWVLPWAFGRSRLESLVCVHILLWSPPMR